MVYRSWLLEPVLPLMSNLMHSTLVSLFPNVLLWCAESILDGLEGPGGAFTQMTSGLRVVPAAGTTLFNVCLARTRVLPNILTLMSLKL